MTDGILTAVDAVKKAADVKSMTAIGYCIGGTLLAATLAVMAARKDKSIRAATFFTAQVDFPSRVTCRFSSTTNSWKTWNG